MKKLSPFPRNKVSLGILFFGMSLICQNSFASYSCQSDWETKEGKAHCHLKILNKTTQLISFICTGVSPVQELGNEVDCQNFCNGSETSEKIARVALAANDGLQLKLQEMGNNLNLAYGKLKILDHIAGDACVKVEMLKSLLEDIGKASGVKINVDEILNMSPNTEMPIKNQKNDSPENRPIPEGMYS